MAVEDTKLFKKWKPLHKKEMMRLAFYETAKRGLPESNPIVTRAKTKWKAAQRAIDKLFAELSDA